MIKKKICLLGAFAVGKTSLMKRYVNSTFSEDYHSTIGAKVDSRDEEIQGQQVRMLIWDLAGEDVLTVVPKTFLRGAAAVIVVIDATRARSLDVAQSLANTVRECLGGIRIVYAINKQDLVDDEVIEELKAQLDTKDTVVVTSAKTGDHVEELFLDLATSLLASGAGVQ